MSTFEGDAVERALAAYGEMSAGYIADIAEQPVGEAVFTDLRAQAAADAAALGVVRGLVAELPLAENDGGVTFFKLTSVDDIPRIRGSVIWGPAIQGNSVNSGPSVHYLNAPAPYYVVGRQSLADQDASRAELLLAPATRPKCLENGEQPPFSGLLVATAWAGELRAADSLMTKMTHAKVTSAEVVTLFDQQTHDLQLHKHGGVVLTHGGDHRSERKVRKGVEAMGDQHAQGREISLPVSDDYMHLRVDYPHGLSRDARTDFNVFPRLVHLAALFGKTDLLRSLVQNLRDEDQQSALEAFVTEQS